MKSLTVLGICVVVLAACDPDTPSERVGRDALLSVVDSGRTDRVRVESFRKIDGQRSELFGVSVYAMDFEAVAEVLLPVQYRAVGPLGGELNKIEVSDVPTDQSFWGDWFNTMVAWRRPLCAGDRLRLKGVVGFGLKESGWVLAEEFTEFTAVVDTTGRAAGCGAPVRESEAEGRPTQGPGEVGNEGSVGTPSGQSYYLDPGSAERLYDDSLRVFRSVVNDRSMSRVEKIARIDELISGGFDLNGEVFYGDTPLKILIMARAADLVEPLRSRGLRLDPSSGDCRVQEWQAEWGALTPGGQEFLRILVREGFTEECLKGSGKHEGFVCGVRQGGGLDTYDVAAAIRAVDFIASLGFDVGAKCYGNTLWEYAASFPDNPEMGARFGPVAEAAQRHIRE